MRQRLTIAEAAALIFRGRTIQRGHLKHIEKWLVQDELDGQCVDGKWYTSRDAIARFLARRSLDDLGESADPTANVGLYTLPHYSAQGEMVGVYRQVLKDYFLAVLMRRQANRLGSYFNRAVLAGQIGIIAFVVGTILFAVLTMTRPAPVEHRAIEQWLAASYEEGFTLVAIGEPIEDSDSEQVYLVKYSYPSKNRGKISTEQYFVVRNGEVVDVASER